MSTNFLETSPSQFHRSAEVAPFRCLTRLVIATPIGQSARMTAARLFLRRGAFLPVQDRKLTLTACHAAPAPALAPSRRFISLSSIKVQVPPEHKDKTLAELVEVGVLSQKAARWLSDKTKGAHQPVAHGLANAVQMKSWATLPLG
jgi:hypothetical protein